MSHDTNLVKKELWESLSSKGNRDAFVASHLSTNIGSQIFAMREVRGWSQEKLAAAVGMAQPRISVLEGGCDCSLRSLKRIASAFDVAVVVRFVPFSELVNWVADLSEYRLAPVDFANDNLPEESDDDEKDGAGAAYGYAAAESSLGFYDEAQTLAVTEGVLTGSGSSVTVGSQVTGETGAGTVDLYGPFQQGTVNVNDMGLSGSDTTGIANQATTTADIWHPRVSVALGSKVPWRQTEALRA